MTTDAGRADTDMLYWSREGGWELKSIRKEVKIVLTVLIRVERKGKQKEKRDAIINPNILIPVSQGKNIL